MNSLKELEPFEEAISLEISDNQSMVLKFNFIPDEDDESDMIISDPILINGKACYINIYEGELCTDNTPSYYISLMCNDSIISNVLIDGGLENSHIDAAFDKLYEYILVMVRTLNS